MFFSFPSLFSQRSFIRNVSTLWIMQITIIFSMANRSSLIQAASVENSTQFEDIRLECKNNNTPVTTGCICPKPWIGPNCNETACVHGQLADQENQSVSSNINHYCQCNAGWTGELCDIRLAKKCSGRGILINSTCICNQFYAGESCNLVVKCNNGDHLNGLCTCHNGWTGDFCDKIICQQNGTLNVAANNTVCVCHPQYTGQFCDSCLFNNTASYPECQELFLPTSTTHIGHHAIDFLKQEVFLSLTVATILIGIIMIFIVALMCVFFGLTKRQTRIARQVEIDQREEVRMQLKAKKAEDDRYYN